MIISISNQKGGVGKTTTTQSLAAGLVDKKKKVLLIDLDPQSNLSSAVGADTQNLTIYEVLNGDVDINKVIQSSNSGDIIPSNLLLTGADIEFFQKMKREELLKNALKKIKFLYDYILIDTPPALGILTINAFTASNRVIIPMGAEAFSMQAVAQLNSTITQVREHCNDELKIEGILITLYKARYSLSKGIMPAIYEIAKKLDTKVFNSFIRESISIKEAQAQGKNTLHYAPKANAQSDYKKFVSELLKGIKNG